MTRKQKRLSIIAAGMGFLALAITLVLFALRQEIVFFRSPSDISAGAAELQGARIRLGGLVEEGSVERGNGTQIRFSVTDGAESVVVRYDGVLPDLFREGQGVVTEGVLMPGGFAADTVLAKHDENYMPREVADALKEQGVWQGEEN